MRCDGYSEEDVERHHDLCIRVYGFVIVQVTSNGPRAPGWTYTIGLRETSDHPDLVCLGGGLTTQSQLISDIGRKVVNRSPPATEAMAEIEVSLRRVPPRMVAGDLVAGWRNRYQRRPGEGDFLELRLGPSWFGPETIGTAPRNQP